MAQILKRNVYKEEMSKICWHEAGHAIWAIAQGKQVLQLTCRANDPNFPKALGYCDIRPECRTYSNEDLSYLLSGIVGEQVGSEIEGYEFNKFQLEWYQALDSAWGKAVHDGSATDWKPMEEIAVELGTFKKYAEVVPERFHHIVEKRYDELIEVARNSTLLPALARTLLERETMTGDEISELISERNSMVEQGF